MDMMTAAFLSIAITTVSVTVVMAGLDAVAHWKFRRRVTPKRARPELRRQATRVVGISASSPLIQPWSLPARVRARILRARSAYRGITAFRRRAMGRASRPGSATAQSATVSDP
jgi:hypothetical protein